MATYVVPEPGAHRTDRIKQGVRDGCLVQLVYCAAAWVAIYFLQSPTPWGWCLSKPTDRP